jgi:Tol biopolymer transport system component
MSARKICLRLASALILSLALIAAGCAGRGVDQSPLSPGVTAPDRGPLVSHHQLWGYWKGYIPESHDSLELVPVRAAMIHVNVRRFLEEHPCQDCVKVVGIQVDSSKQILTAQIQLTHPFPGLIKFTGFDVRAVVISDGSLYFPALDATVPDPESGDFTLIAQDGYTRLWNSLEFPPGSGQFRIHEYSRGNLASPGDFTGTVNPFIAFGTGQRNHFPAGSALTREFQFRLVPGPIRFGYAVDASWEPPLVDPPVNIPDDFSVSANALEPGLTRAWIEPLHDTQGSTAGAQFHLFDYQGWETVREAWLECPDLWTGAVSATSIECELPTPDGDMLTVDFNLTNELGATVGTKSALLKVADEGQDFWLGDVNHMYERVCIEVIPAQQLTGKIVFSAPGPSGPHGEPPAMNVFLLDLETMLETQLTPFIGDGPIFDEPRINPVGTHMLLTFCPTPTASGVDVYEIGGGSWGISPAAVYDGTADFHPDGEHILIASGTQFTDTPNLYSVKYDGSERTLVATADDTVRNPRWSPDGKRIVMTQGLDFSDPPNSSLWIYDVDSDQFFEIMSAPGVDENPCWSPVKVGGQDLIVFASNRDHYPDYETDIYVANPDTEEIVYRFDMGLVELHPSFSPDGLSFVFSAPTPNGEELFVFSWQTEELLQLTDDTSHDGSPSWCWNW